LNIDEKRTVTTTSERHLLRQSVTALVDKHAAPAAVRRAMVSPLGYDESLWAMLCEQVGVGALVVPESLGGAGGEFADAAAVLEELGRGLVPSSGVGTRPRPSSSRTAAASGRLATGESVGAVVFDDHDYVVNGAAADVVLAVTDGRILRWTDVTAEPRQSLDPTRRLARVRPGGSMQIAQDPGIADMAAILLAAEQVGAAQRCLELTVDYTKQRVQFGRPIGSFQALKHRMADLYVAVQAARATVGDAVASPGPVRAALARLAATEAFCTVAGEAIQLHGGIAITWEHDMHLYFKRAYSSAQLFGPPREQLRALEDEVF